MTETPEGTLEKVARLFGGLLLHELDERTRSVLLTDPLAEALASTGVDIASLAACEDIDLLAVEFLETFLQPRTGGPLVQSLWTEGSYEGDSAVAIRKLATAAGVEFDRDAARAAPHDHLGCILLLWAATRGHAPPVATRIEQQHLAWSLAPLERLAAREGFYASVARATGGLVRELVALGGEGSELPDSLLQ